MAMERGGQSGSGPGDVVDRWTVGRAKFGPVTEQPKSGPVTNNRSPARLPNNRSPARLPNMADDDPRRARRRSVAHPTRMRIVRLAAFAAAALLAACTGSTNSDDLAATDATDSATDARLAPTPSGVTTAMCSNTIDMSATGTLA